MSTPRKSISVKPTVHELYRKATARLSNNSQKQRVTIAELIEFFAKSLPTVTLEEINAK